jgi:tRNA pseudouridine55 synthase
VSSSSPLEGGLLVDKPEGPTSHDMVARARRALGVRRVGHTGTLDPFASGLLVLLVGRATRLAEYLDDFPKEYLARARLGVRTDTDDREGEVVAESPAWEGLDPSRVTASLEALTGDLDQVPPAYSAKKRGGEAAYRKARRGETVVLDPVRVRVHEIQVEEVALPWVDFRVVCSTGTYIRALARDAGESLGVGGHLVSLRRTRIGPFRVEEAFPGDALDPERAGEATGSPSWWRTPLELLGHLEGIQVDEEAAARLASGQGIELPTAPDAGEGVAPVALAVGERLVAVAERRGTLLQPRKVFAHD